MIRSRSKGNHATRAAVALIAVTMGISACSSDSKESDATSPAPTTIATSPTTGPSAPTTAAGSPTTAAAPTTTEPDLRAPGTVNIAVVGGYTTAVTGLMIANQPEYLGAVAERFSTKINIVPYPSLPAAQAGFFGGSDQFIGGSATTSVISPSIAGQDVTGIFQAFSGIGLVMLGEASLEATHKNDITAFDGAHWCFAAAGTAGELASKALATASGLDWNDQQGIAIGSQAAVLPALSSKQCDILAAETSVAATAISQGLGYVVANFNDVDTARLAFGGAQLGFTISTSDSFREEYPGLTQAIVTAMLEANLWVKDNADDPAEIYSHLPADFTKVISADIYAEAWSMQKLAYSNPDGRFTDEDIQSTIEYAQSTGALAPGEDFDVEHLTNEYVDQAHQELGV